METKIKEIFGNAQQNIAKGDIQTALAYCDKINNQGTKYPEIYRMYGYIDMYNGNYESAFENYKTAIGLADNKEIYACELMVAYIESGQPDKAIEFGLDRVLLDSDNVLALLSIAYANKTDMQKSIEYYKKIKNPNANSPFISNIKGIISVKAGDHESAIKHFNEALKLKPDYIDCYLNLGLCFIETNRPVNALMNNKHALNIRPVNKIALENVIYLCREYEVFSEGVPHVLKAISLRYKNPSLHLFLARVYHQQNDFEKAVECCDNAININKEFIHSYDLKSKILERMGKLEEAENSINEGFKYDPNHSGFYHSLAIIRLREGKYDEAYKNCSRAEELNNAKSIKYEILDTKAKVLDKLKRYRKAYKTFAMVQSHYQNLWNARNINDNQFFSEDVEKYFTKETVSKWNGRSYNGQAPVFFMGFPRSGTTLVETMLSCHSNNLVSSEVASVNHVSEEIGKILNNRNFQYPFDLDSLSIEQLDKLREYYWNIMKVSAFNGEELENKCIIDKFPLNILYLGFIYRLFPNAKIIFAIRDPRDVCLSCFFQIFNHNRAMSNFYTMEDTVKFYDNVMDLYLKLRDIVPLDIKEYRYEDLVKNPKNILRELFDFIEQPWEEGVMEYYKKKRNVNTPSYIGIDKPIYKTAMKRWENYDPELKPYLPKLEKYINEFGYKNS